jgi:beta-lactam-binding protein with PASTA domain
MDHLAIHCLPPGRAWSEMDDATELAEQLAIAITDRIPWQERAAAVDPTTPLHRLLRGDLREPAGSAPGTPSPPADGAALQVLRGSDAGNAPPLLGDDLPVLAASADALIRYEAGHPWSLGPRMAAACATRLASPVLFRWRPGYEDWIERPDPNAWHAEAQRFALQAQRPKRLHRLAANPRLGPAGQYLVAHAADRAFAHDTGPAEVVGAPIGDLVLTTGLPALALQSGMRRAVVEVHRARSRRRLRMGLAAVAVVVSVALATWQLQRSDGASGNRPITTTSEPTTVAPEDDDDPVAPESDDRTVPDLKGRLEAEARDLLAALDFTVSPTVRRADAAVEEGKVIDSTPPGGTQAKKGDPVALIVSTGPASSGGGGGGTVAVPDVTDLPEDEARARLERDGFTVSDVEPEESSTVDQGRVIRTKPPAGAQVQPGLAVALVVSAGPFEPGGSIPDVGGLSEAEATERLRAAGFEVNVEHTEADSPSDPDIGTVGDQSPPAGTKAPEGAEVTITVVDPPSEPPPPPPTPPTVGPVIR